MNMLYLSCRVLVLCGPSFTVSLLVQPSPILGVLLCLAVGAVLVCPQVPWAVCLMAEVVFDGLQLILMVSTANAVAATIALFHACSHT